MIALASNKRRLKCPVCDRAIDRQLGRGRQQKFCSDNCRQRAFRKGFERNEKALQWVIADSSQTEFRYKQNQGVRETKKPVSANASLEWKEVNEVSWKLTDGRPWRTPGSFGQWAGYETEFPVAWVVNTGWPAKKPLWYARASEKSWGPSISFARAKEAARALVSGAPLPQDETATAFNGEIDLTAIMLPGPPE